MPLNKGEIRLTPKMITDELLGRFKRNLEWSDRVKSPEELRREIDRCNSLAKRWGAIRRIKNAEKQHKEMLALLAEDK